jgi:N-acetylglutamate synthase-like GNAT family acetyltransferase
MTAHWGIEDPAAVEGTDLEKEAAFVEAFRFMKNRVTAFTNLPLDSIDRMATERELRLIGRQAGATAFSLEAIDSGAEDLRAALAAEHQPVEDLGGPGQHLFRVRRGGDVVGFGGYELHGDSALLRSVVVVPAQRGHGIGRTAIGLLLRRASSEGARKAWLLTETAVPFFEKLGFARIDRASAPAAIASSRQASSLCPASASLMTRSLPL